MSEKLSTQRARFSLRHPLSVLAENNPGSLRVILDVSIKIDMHDFHSFILNMDDMNIRGSQIWLAYKDGCGENLDALIRRVNDRDPVLVEVINRANPGGEQAVTHGASYAHR